MMSTSTPKSEPVKTSIAPWLSVSRAREAVDYYKAAFGEVERYRLEDNEGSVVVAQLAIEGKERALFLARPLPHVVHDRGGSHRPGQDSVQGVCRPRVSGDSAADSNRERPRENGDSWLYNRSFRSMVAHPGQPPAQESDHPS